MRTIFLQIIIFSSAVFGLWSQDLVWETTISKEDINTEDHGKPRILFAQDVDSGFLVLREQVYRTFKKRKFLLDRLDAELNLIFSTDVSEQVDEKKFEIQEVIRLENSLLLLSTFYNRDENKRYFYFQELEYGKASFGAKKLITSISLAINDSYKITLNKSPDEQKVLVSIIPYKRVPLIGKQDNDYRFLIRLNAQLEVERDYGRVDMVSTDGLDFEIYQTLIGSDQKLYFLAQDIPDKKSKVPEWFLLQYSDGLIYEKLPFDKGFITRAKIMQLNNGQVLFFGYYSEEQRFNPGVGQVTAVFDKNSLKILNNHNELIKNEVMFTGMSDRSRKKWEREIKAGRDLKLNQDIIPLHVHEHPSGEVTVVGEIQYITVESVGLTQAGNFNRLTYNFEHIFVTRLNSRGQVLWTTKIPKLYRGNMDLVESFYPFYFGEDLFFVFNDNFQNFFISPRKGVRYLSGRSRFNYLASFFVNPKGEARNKSIFEYSNAPFLQMNMFNLFTDVAKTNQNQMVMITSGRFGYRYMSVCPKNTALDE